MGKWSLLVVFVFSASVLVPVDAYARRSGSHGHSHGRRASLNFRFPLPSYKSHSRPTNPAPVYKAPIYKTKEYPLPRIYTLDKPLVDDPRIYRPLNIRKEYSPDFYKYDKKKNQYSTSTVLHDDARFAHVSRYPDIKIEGQIFYYNNGFFYKKEGDHLLVVPPVINSIVQSIPRNSAHLSGDNYKYKGIYYKQISGGYQVIGLPISIRS